MAKPFAKQPVDFCLNSVRVLPTKVLAHQPDSGLE